MWRRRGGAGCWWGCGSGSDLSADVDARASAEEQARGALASSLSALDHAATFEGPQVPRGPSDVAEATPIIGNAHFQCEFHPPLSQARVRVGRFELPRAFAPRIANERRLPVPPHPHQHRAVRRHWLLRRDTTTRDAAGCGQAVTELVQSANRKTIRAVQKNVGRSGGRNGAPLGDGRRDQVTATLGA